MKLVHASMALVLSCIACGDGHSKDSKGGGNKRDDSSLVGSESFSDIDQAALESGTTISIPGLKGNKAYRFTLPRAGTIEKMALHSRFDCSGNPNARLSLRRVTASNTVASESLARFDSVSGDSLVNLEAGTYAFVFESAPGASCSRFSFDVTVRANLSVAADSGGTGTTGGGTGSTGGGASGGTSGGTTATDPEAMRIYNRELKDSAGFSFFAYASKSEGCVPVLTRTVGDLKKVIADIPSSRVGPVRFVVSTEFGTRQSYSIETNTGGFLFQLLDFYVHESTPALKTALETTLIRNSAVSAVSLDDTCASSESLAKVDHAAAFDDLPLWATDNKLPLKASGSFPDAKFTYRTEAGKESLAVKLGVDISKVLGDLNLESSAVTGVEWMLGSVKMNSWDYPISDWQPLNLSEFLAGRVNINANSLAARGIFHFRYGSIAIKVTTNNIANRHHIFVLSTGSLCSAAYSRPDGAAFHNALFSDLTHPEWNNAPSVSEKRGCAFIGTTL